MKTKMNQAEKQRRQSWRDQAHQAPSQAAAREPQVAKSLRVKKVSEQKVEVTEAKSPIAVLADLFKGTSYKGPYVHVTHKQAFEARELKRVAKALANVAMETVQN